jgi:hypothetical protein
MVTVNGDPQVILVTGATRALGPAVRARPTRLAGQTGVVVNSLLRSGIDDPRRHAGELLARCGLDASVGRWGRDPHVQVASTMLKKSRRACATWSGASRAA